MNIGSRLQGDWKTIYSEKICGNKAFVDAAHDILAGKSVTFVGCTREPASAPPVIQEIYRFAMGTIDGKLVPRYCGENNNPDGSRSSSLIALHYGDQCTNPEYIAVALVQATRKYSWVFRIKEEA